MPSLAHSFSIQPSQDSVPAGIVCPETRIAPVSCRIAVVVAQQAANTLAASNFCGNRVSGHYAVIEAEGRPTREPCEERQPEAGVSVADANADEREQRVGLRSTANGACGKCFARGEKDARKGRQRSAGAQKNAESDINLQGLTLRLESTFWVGLFRTPLRGRQEVAGEVGEDGSHWFFEASKRRKRTLFKATRSRVNAM